MRRLRSKTGQSTLEYAILIAVIVGGLIAMQVYVKRGVQGRLRSSADDIGGQYSPGYVESSFTTETSSTTMETVDAGLTTSQASTTQSRTGSESVQSLENEWWPD